MTETRDYARELYPFLYAPATGTAAGREALHASVRSSTLAKCADVIALRNELLVEYSAQLDDAARELARRFGSGGTLLAFGNGGSATDADDAAADCLSPPLAGWRKLPGISLPSDSATMSALCNDVGLDAVFARQVAGLGRAGDIALGFSTSGNSGNVVAAFGEARKRGMLCVALLGYDGGAIARSGAVDYCFVARREFVPRIQEGHATLWHALLELVHVHLADARSVP